VLEIAWLGFLEAFRTFCRTPRVELNALMKELGNPSFKLVRA